MNRMKHSLLRLLLALALPLAPLWHAAGHAQEHVTHPGIACDDQQSQAGHLHAAVSQGDDCESCQALSQQVSLPLAASLPLASEGEAAALGASTAPGVSFEFTYFEHRGPPQSLAV